MSRDKEVMFAISVPDLIHGEEAVYHDGHEVVDSAIWREHVWLDYAEGGGAWFEQDQEIMIEFEVKETKKETVVRIVQNAEPVEIEALKRGTHVMVGFLGVLDSRPANGIARVRPVGHVGWIAVVPTDTVQPVIED